MLQQAGLRNNKAVRQPSPNPTNGHPSPKLIRQTLRTSREMDFLSQRELVTQTGHDVGDWPLVIAKETMDNALDACDEADIPPVMHDLLDMDERVAPAFAARVALCRQARDDLTYYRLLVTLFRKAVEREHGPEVAAVVASTAKDLEPRFKDGPGTASDSPPVSP
jgi:hypothetical protein